MNEVFDHKQLNQSKKISRTRSAVFGHLIGKLFLLIWGLCILLPSTAGAECSARQFKILTMTLGFRIPIEIVEYNRGWLSNIDYSCSAYKEAGITPENVQQYEHLLDDSARSAQLKADLLILNNEVGDPTAPIEKFKVKYAEFNWTRPPAAQTLDAIREKYITTQRSNKPENCTEIAKINVGPIRTQEAPWCLGMVAADMLSNASGKFLSVADLSQRYNVAQDRFHSWPNLSTEQFLLQGSFGSSFAPVLKSAQGGLCLEDNFNSGFVTPGRHSTRVIIDYLQEVAHGHISNKTLAEMKMVFPKLRDPNILTSPYDRSTLVRAADSSCGVRVAANDFGVEEKFKNDFKNQTNMYNVIDAHLASGLIIGISLDADSIDSGLAISSTSGHAVSIVGRHFDSALGKCQYLIRNSWGPEWASGGYKFLGRDHLFSGVSEISYLEKK